MWYFQIFKNLLITIRFIDYHNQLIKLSIRPSRVGDQLKRWNEDINDIKPFHDIRNSQTSFECFIISLNKLFNINRPVLFQHFLCMKNNAYDLLVYLGETQVSSLLFQGILVSVSSCWNVRGKWRLQWRVEKTVYVHVQFSICSLMNSLLLTIRFERWEYSNMRGMSSVVSHSHLQHGSI